MLSELFQSLPIAPGLGALLKDVYSRNIVDFVIGESVESDREMPSVVRSSIRAYLRSIAPSQSRTRVPSSHTATLDEGADWQTGPGPRFGVDYTGGHIFWLILLTQWINSAAAADSRNKRSVVAYMLPVAAPTVLPANAKSTTKTAFYEPNEAALTPVSTTKIDLKEKDQEIMTRLACSYPAYPHVAPLAAAKLVAAPYYGHHTIF